MQCVIQTVAHQSMDVNRTDTQRCRALIALMPFMRFISQRLLKDILEMACGVSDTFDTPMSEEAPLKPVQLQVLDAIPSVLGAAHFGEDARQWILMKIREGCRVLLPPHYFQRGRLERPDNDDDDDDDDNFTVKMRSVVLARSLACSNPVLNNKDIAVLIQIYAKTPVVGEEPFPMLSPIVDAYQVRGKEGRGTGMPSMLLTVATHTLWDTSDTD